MFDATHNSLDISHDGNDSDFLNAKLSRNTSNVLLSGYSRIAQHLGLLEICAIITI